MSCLTGKSFNPVMNRRSVIAGVAGLGAVGILAGCSGNESEGGSTAAADDGSAFKIGAIGPLTGSAASYGTSVCNGVELACGQFVCGSIIASAAVLIAESPTIEGLQGALLPILWAGIMSNGIAYTLQIVGQRGMNETVASLIMSLESAIAVIAGWLLLGEVLSQRELFGCVLMAGAVVLAQLPAPKSRRSGKD